VNFGILICGTGIGMSITANKIKGVYAALACNVLLHHLQGDITMPTFYVSVEGWLGLNWRRRW